MDRLLEIITRSLNPYSIGRWSVRMKILQINEVRKGLNPYSIGRWSVSTPEEFGGTETYES